VHSQSSRSEGEGRFSAKFRTRQNQIAIYVRSLEVIIIKLNRRRQTHFRLYKPQIVTSTFGDVSRVYPGLYESERGEEGAPAFCEFKGNIQPEGVNIRSRRVRAKSSGLSSDLFYNIYTEKELGFAVLDRILSESGAIYEIEAITVWRGMTTLFVTMTE
jgi:hypothetical protein